MLRAVFREGDALSARFDGGIAEHRLKWFPIRPRGGIHRLPIIVRVENHRAFGFRRNQFPKNYRPAPADGEQMRFDAPRLQHLHQMRRVFLDVRRVARNVGDRKKFAKFPDDAVFILHPVFAHCLRDLRRRRRSWLLRESRGRQKSNQQSNRNISQRFPPLALPVPNTRNSKRLLETKSLS